MNGNAGEFVAERPVVATVVVAAVATVAYVAIQLVAEGAVDSAETATFVLIFTVVYVGGKRLLHSRREDSDTDADGSEPADGETADAAEEGTTDADTVEN